MKRFHEFVDEKTGVVKDPSAFQLDQAELLQRIVRQHGARFRHLIKSIVQNGDADDDPELLADLKELARSLSRKVTDDQYPVRDKQRHDKEPDIVSRPKADGGGDINRDTGGDGQ